MSNKEPFDPIRASFYLISAILGVQCVVALISLGTCVYWSGHVVDGKGSCENINGLLSQLLTGALAAALAFAAGFTRKDK